MRHALVGLLMAGVLGATTPAISQFSLSFAGPGVRIGFNVPAYPVLERIPGYPVYYAPALNANYFFYDGMYWFFDGNGWYASSWYDGPWYLVDPFDMPVFLLRVPVRYYRHAPVWFHSYAVSAPPHWGEHWGRSWEARRTGWNRSNRAAAPSPAPLPTYQRQYSGGSYPQQAQQAAIQSRSYTYQPKETIGRQHFQQQRTQVTQAPTQSQNAPRPQAVPVQERAQPAARPEPPRAERAPQGQAQAAPAHEPRGEAKGRERREGQDTGQHNGG